jgi:hypothetical protein
MLQQATDRSAETKSRPITTTNVLIFVLGSGEEPEKIHFLFQNISPKISLNIALEL